MIKKTLQPSNLAYVPFVSVDNMMKIVNEIGLAKIISGMASYIEEDFKRWPDFDKKPRIATHTKEGVIELMPTSDGETYGFKYVNGHPANMNKGFQTVTAFGLLARADNGYPILLSEMTILTALRTAATSAVAAKYLAPKNSKTMTLIGNGAQCEFQVIAFNEILDVKKFRLFDIDTKAIEKAAKNLSKENIDIDVFKSSEEAVQGADIITTCTADKQYATILTDNMVGNSLHINAIGGDCPGKTEIHKDILLRSEIFVEYTPQTRIEGEIQQLDSEHPVTELWKVMTGKSNGRKDERQITLFDSVGFATEDFSSLRYIYDTLRTTGNYQKLDMIADPDDPRDLFGMIQRAKRNKE